LKVPIATIKIDPVLFIRAIWQRMGYDRVAPIGPPEISMIRYMHKGPRHRGILSWRGVGKTHLVMAYAAWRLFRAPGLKIAIVSKTGQHAIESLTMFMGWTKEIPWLADMHPRRKVGHRKSARHGQIDVGTCPPGHRSASLTCLGIEQQLEGKRAHILIADDVETDENTYSPDTRNKLDKRVREFSKVCSYGKREIIYVGTYHHADSVYMRLAARGYHFRTWPILYPTMKELYGPTGDLRMIGLAPEIAKALQKNKSIEGTMVFPHRTDRGFIDDAKAEGLDSWYMHYMLINDTGETNRYPLRMADCMVIDTVDVERAPRRLLWGIRAAGGKADQDTSIEDIVSLGFGDDCWRRPAHSFTGVDDYIPYEDTKMWIDPAGRGEDRVGYCVIGLCNGFLHVKECASLPGGYEEETLHRLCKIAKEALTREIVIESNYGAGMLEPLMMRILRGTYFNIKSPEPYAGDISGQAAIESARQHPESNKKWTCHVRTQNVTRQKEIRILDALEPITHGHKLIIPRKVAESESFQLQYTRIQKKKGCLDRDDEIESLAMCVGLFADRMDVTVEQTEEHARRRQIQEAQEWQKRQSMEMAGSIATNDETVWMARG